jgi:hypothetical protein
MCVVVGWSEIEMTPVDLSEMKRMAVDSQKRKIELMDWVKRKEAGRVEGMHSIY